MSIDNEYLLARINALQVAIGMLGIGIESTIRTNGMVNSAVSQLNGVALALQADRLDVLLGLKVANCSTKSENEFINSFPDGLSKEPDAKEVFKNTLFNSEEKKKKFDIFIRKDGRVDLTGFSDGEALICNKGLSVLFSEQSLISMYDKLKGIVSIRTFEDINKTFQMFTSNIDYKLNTEQVLEAVGPGLVHKYSIDGGMSRVTIEIDDVNTKVFFLSRLTDHNRYKLDLPFWAHKGLLEDAVLFSDSVEKILSLVSEEG